MSFNQESSFINPEAIKWTTFWKWVLAVPPILPIFFMAPSILTLNGGVVHSTGNDVLGTGSALILFAMLSVTPLRTLTRKQWFVPLRRWYAIWFGFTVLVDAATASNDTAFNGGPGAELVAHTFSFLGSLMTIIVLPLLIQGLFNKWTMKQMGRYWKPFQKFGTYTIWGLLGLHLLVLDGFGVEHINGLGTDTPPFNVFHQRFYQFLSVSAGLVILRLPPVTRWIRKKQKEGKMRQVWFTITPLLLLFVFGYTFLRLEFFFKGMGAFTLNPVDD